MRCFHFTGVERREDEEVAASRSSKVSWARSFSAASSIFDTRRSELESESREFDDSVAFYAMLTQRRTNDLRVFSFSELKSATRGFSRVLVIGEGGFGCVFRGVVSSVDGSNSKMDVAVKQLNRSGFQACYPFPSLRRSVDCDPALPLTLYVESAKSNVDFAPFHSSIQGHKEWINEVNFLGVIKHPNLIKLVGYCAEDDERGIQRLLVYELMHNKSLEDHLISRVSTPLPWMVRLRIAQDAARGLAYLHEEMDFQKLLEWVRPYVSDPKKFRIILDPRLKGERCIRSARKLASLANKCLLKQPRSRPKMSHVVEMLGNITSETASEVALQMIYDPEASELDIMTKEAGKEAESVNQGAKYMKNAFDLSDRVNLRNKSTRKLDWRN
ncbi:hypothetical protein SAY87_017891 [Trapa incisa]|uniref:Protein kinase domain-containing protein n=1 Tax=Trapa incisa TaxID=236973 RepID=A0AAN7L550_9MYRT|nr:hypothetical protein SAY87_017891 [Trapa incisa]